MLSRLYECQVTHARLAPRRHRFSYRIFLLSIDLDELPTLARRLRLLSVNRPGLYSFRESDYLPTESPSAAQSAGTAPSTSKPAATTPLKTRVLAFLASRGVPLPAATRVELVTLPRILGYLFNPVSFYFCRDASGTPLAAIAEVTNTFGEVKPYVLGPDSFRAAAPPAAAATSVASAMSAASPSPVGAFRLRTPKHFYVSPFSDVDVAFDFRLRPPAERLDIRIDDHAGDTRTLASSLLGAARPLTDRRLLYFLFKYPLLTLRVVLLIHWHALRLFLKKIPWFPKAARPADQRDLDRPHASRSPRCPSALAP